MRKGVTCGVSLVTSLSFLIDPCFDRSYRGGRVEALVFLTVFAACWLISGLCWQSPKKQRCSMFGAGLLIGILPWLWTTAVLLLPLVMVELWRVLHPHAGRSVSRWCSILLPFVVGALISTVGLAAPAWDLVEVAMEATLHHVCWDSSAANPAIEGSSGLLSSVFSVVRYSPFLPLLALLGGCIRGNRLLLGASLLVLVVVMGTRFYLYRYLYVLPYLAVLAGAGVMWLRSLPATGVLRTLVARVPSVLALGWAVLLTLGVRSYVAFQERPWRDHAAMVSMLGKEVGRGGITVYMGAYDVYFAGRELGWKMLRNKFTLSSVKMGQIYERCDVVLRVSEEDSPEFRSQMLRLGFDGGRTIHAGPREIPSEFQKPRYGGRAYGTYRLHRRVPSATP
ncbi:MAG: hypothetical protein JNM65_18960 [Verrucomicrobiaceae bacterium]|nr:hypothetical protein [Verrucomicrobiaceae bacterium]